MGISGGDFGAEKEVRRKGKVCFVVSRFCHRKSAEVRKEAIHWVRKWNGERGGGGGGEGR